MFLQVIKTRHKHSYLLGRGCRLVSLKFKNLNFESIFSWLSAIKNKMKDSYIFTDITELVGIRPVNKVKKRHVE